VKKGFDGSRERGEPCAGRYREIFSPRISRSVLGGDGKDLAGGEEGEGGRWPVGLHLLPADLTVICLYVPHKSACIG